MCLVLFRTEPCVHFSYIMIYMCLVLFRTEPGVQFSYIMIYVFDFVQASTEPGVHFEADEGSLWTLLMTNPDGHLTDNDSEYLHWFVYVLHKTHVFLFFLVGLDLGNV